MKDQHETSSSTEGVEVGGIDGKPGVQHLALVADYVPDTEDEKKLLRKIDLFLLPTIW